MISYKDLCILKLTGILEPHNEKEFIIPKEMIKGYRGDFFTCEFLKDSKYIIRCYYKSGNKWWEEEYKNGLLHGKDTGWWKNGNKWWEREYKNGLRHGKHIEWWKNGNELYNEEYKDGECLCGKYF